jgi:hypothetical protein
LKSLTQPASIELDHGWAVPHLGENIFLYRVSSDTVKENHAKVRFFSVPRLGRSHYFLVTS